MLSIMCTRNLSLYPGALPNVHLAILTFNMHLRRLTSLSYDILYYRVFWNYFFRIKILFQLLSCALMFLRCWISAIFSRGTSLVSTIFRSNHRVIDSLKSPFISSLQDRSVSARYTIFSSRSYKKSCNEQRKDTIPTLNSIFHPPFSDERDIPDYSQRVWTLSRIEIVDY